MSRPRKNPSDDMKYLDGGTTGPTPTSSQASTPKAAGSMEPDTNKRQFTPSDVGLSIFFYGLWSSVMLVSNKVTIHSIPLPATIFSVQIALTVVFIMTARSFELLRADPLTRDRVRTWFPYACSFCITIYCSGKVLTVSNVETVIVFRSCTPLTVCFMDYVFLGRSFPSLRSAISLLVVVAGAIGYVLQDSQFQLEGLRTYFWVFLYLVTITFEMTFGKYLIASVNFEAPVWSSVLYTNILALPVMAFGAVISGELQRIDTVKMSTLGAGALVVSLVGGIAISWAGWNCREKTTATAYTLLGVICKLVSVLLNIAIWDKHATPLGCGWLAVCVVAGSFYQQAPLRIVQGSCVTK
eukprot:TRINITY_DN74973_c0_g1_i1.p1 TRINITY_DN74973_c0_g1~~TRINITY_DN74973_c0_g1_i1.p1  ORF type:complete len:354 (-),score=34.41 TRINITY_DN74973_c0_g1_i1:127-1188(-)